MRTDLEWCDSWWCEQTSNSVTASDENRPWMMWQLVTWTNLEFSDSRWWEQTLNDVTAGHVNKPRIQWQPVMRTDLEWCDSWSREQTSNSVTAGDENKPWMMWQLCCACRRCLWRTHSVFRFPRVSDQSLSTFYPTASHTPANHSSANS